MTMTQLFATIYTLAQLAFFIYGALYFKERYYGEKNRQSCHKG